jgi:serine/threonine-protein kinase
VDSPVVEDVVLAGRYRLRALLGTGGMAQVYDGWDERLARPVAVKLLRPDLAAVADLRRRFELEARAAARLSHPNVVAIFDAGDDHGRSFIVMERLRGETLADSIERGPVDVDWLRRLAGEVLAALAAAHAAGIVHRDIKPGNILLGPDGRAKVADFGIARVVEPPPMGSTEASAETAAALTGVGLVVGTPAYLAPERAMGEPATPQSDLYSVGVVLYEALTGRKPYTGTTPAAIAAAAVQGAVVNPSSLRPDADPELVAVIGRAMALDPAQRYATAADMAADLRRSTRPARTTLMPALVAPTVADVSGAVVPTVADGGAVVPTVGDVGAAAPTVADAPGVRDRHGRRLAPPGGRLWLVALGVAALVVVAVAVIAAHAGPGSRAASTTATTPAPAPTTVTTAPVTHATLPPAFPAPTTPTVVATGQTDPLAAALQTLVKRLAGSKSAAAGDLAAALSRVAALTDPAARAAAASSVLEQTVQWYQQGKLTMSEYVIAAALLHTVGAPQAPPPTVKHPTNAAGGGGGGGA